MAANAINFKHKPFDPTKAHLRIDEVRRMVHRSTSWIYLKMKTGEFPVSCQISPSLSLWRLEDIEEYLIETAKRYGSGVVERT